MKLHRNLGFVMSIFFIGLSALMFWQSWKLGYYSSLGPGPGLFPRWLSGALLILSILYMFSTLRQPIVWSEVMPRGRDLRNVLLVLASSAVFMVLLSTIGFVLAGGLMMVFLLARSYSWFRASAIALSVNVLIYIAFSGWLDVPLPSGQVWDWVR